MPLRGCVFRECLYPFVSGIEGMDGARFSAASRKRGRRTEALKSVLEISAEAQVKVRVEAGRQDIECIEN